MIDEIGKCGICGLIGTLQLVNEHFLQAHVNGSDNSEVIQIQDENDSYDANVNEEKGKWPREYVLLLIRLVEKNMDLFDSMLKKSVWIKISDEVSKIIGKNYSHEQTDNKWKGLKKTYKKIKDNNNKSGNSRSKWEFFDVMDNFMSKKPEIMPLATCSSTKGLMTNNVVINEKSEDLADAEYTQDSEESNELPSSSYSRKRKKLNAVQKRHEEKMKRYDDFLKIFKISVEHQTGEKIDL